ncbi:TonB-dependent receptor [Hyunsoonleella sp. SJ7]|uniref:TonB-dependent receptor n=1 Tax=Hyunsoonleella aquatilis TaxID=2762758 RepID=A0A923H9H3_9FLAO|nr:TonB-dependent receptor [Hyunsoonleella aquatilis]MBC3756806.1 TonB-dependent receptor [Hyunsoonleella aquatilis]
MKFTSLLLLLLLCTCSLKAQEVKVANAITQEPISGVAIFDKRQAKSAITNFKGVAQLDQFSPNDTLYFQHLSHETKILIKSHIPKSNIVYLDANTQGLNEIVISASKFEQNKKDIPQKIISFNSEKIELMNPQTSADLLQNSGMVFVQKSQLGGGSPMIRGFSTNRLLITVDGVRMNNAIFRGGNLHNVISIDPLSIENTEIILGPGSVIYGSDAIGGVMGFYTQTPRLSESDSIKVSSNILTRYATASNEKTAHFDINLGYKKWAFVTNATFTDFNDLRMGSHGPEDYLRSEFVSSSNGNDVILENSNPKVQKFSGYHQFNAMQKVRYKPYKDLSFDLGLYYSRSSDIPRYDRLIRYEGDALRSAEWHYGPQKWFMSNLQVTKLTSNSNLYDKVKATLAFQNFKESRIDRDFLSNDRNIREESLNAYSFNLDFEKRLSDKTRFFYGGEYVHNKVMSEGRLEDISSGILSNTISRYPNGATWKSAAIYSSLKYKPNTRFVFQTGVRFNHVGSKADFTENNAFLNLPFQSAKNSAGAFSGTAGLTWSPNTTMQWKLNAASAFRAPNIDDIGKVFDSEPGSVVVPNENLRPEYAYGGELGLKLNFDQKLVLDLNTYYTYLDNALVRRDYTLNGQSQIMYDGEMSNVQAIQNASKAWIYGFEAGLKLLVSKYLRLTSQYSVIGGTEENDNIEVPIRHVAPSFGNIHVIWAGKKLTIDAFTEYNGELSFNQLAPSEKQKDYLYTKDANGNPYAPSWYTINLRTQYKVNKSTTLTVSLENITDQRYRPYSSGIAAPGRNLIIALKYSF